MADASPSEGMGGRRAHQPSSVALEFLSLGAAGNRHEGERRGDNNEEESGRGATSRGEQNTARPYRSVIVVRFDTILECLNSIDPLCSVPILKANFAVSH